VRNSLCGPCVLFLITEDGDPQRVHFGPEDEADDHVEVHADHVLGIDRGRVQVRSAHRGLRPAPVARIQAAPCVPPRPWWCG